MKSKIIIIFITVLSICLIGCTMQTNSTNKLNSPIFLVIIFDKNNNSKNINPHALEDTIKEVCLSVGNFSIIMSDSDPSIIKDIGNFSNNKLEEISRNVNDGAWDKYYKSLFSKKGTVDEIIKKNKPDDNENDLLKSLQMAEKQLTVMEDSYKKYNPDFNINKNKITKKIIVCSTGLSTRGSINFCNEKWMNLISDIGDDFDTEKSKNRTENLSKLIDELKALHEMPKFENTLIEWYGLAEISKKGIQPELSNVTKDNLKYVWQSVLKQSGADCEFIVDSYEENIDLYDTYVSPIFFDYLSILDEKIGGFYKNEASLINETETLNALEPISNILIQNNEKILLIGSAADDGTYIYEDPSLGRAQEIKRLLVKLGVKEKNIETIGLGANAPKHINETSQTGNFIEELADENRSVHIVYFNSDIAKEVLNLNYITK